jgi:peptidoglycan-N-acetylglucosamine deacetylase
MITRQLARVAEKVFPGTFFLEQRDSQGVFLTFDDGPHPETTPRILEKLSYYNAKATFFCVGRNAEKYRKVYELIISEGHAVGNHSWSHPNGWVTATDNYLADVKKASAVITSELFRPPYGRITPLQYLHLRKYYSIIMWTRQFADYRTGFDAGRVNLKQIQRGDILVMHDSVTAASNTVLLLDRLMELNLPLLPIPTHPRHPSRAAVRVNGKPWPDH